jgi:hypothetical protein
VNECRICGFAAKATKYEVGIAEGLQGKAGAKIIAASI